MVGSRHKCRGTAVLVTRHASRGYAEERMGVPMPEDEVIFYRRNLPHIHPRGGTFFITFRLAGSLPVHVLRKLQAQKESEIRSLQKQQSQREFEEEKYKIERRYFGKYDGLLDKFSHGPRWLGEERIARIVIEKLHECDGKRFRISGNSGKVGRLEVQLFGRAELTALGSDEVCGF